MKTKIMKIFSILISTFILLSTAACHQHGERHSFSRINDEGHVQKISEKLDLDADQQAKLDTVVSTMQGHKNKHGNHGQLSSAFIGQFKKDDFDEGLLQKEVKEYIRELETASEQFIADLGAFHASLSTEQREKLAKLLEGEKPSRHN